MGAGSTLAGGALAGLDPEDPAGTEVQVLPQGALLYDLTSRGVPRDPTTGLLATIHWVDQAVAVALGVKQGSLTSSTSLGNTLRAIKRAGGPQLVNQVEDAVRVALFDLLDRGDVDLVSIQVTTPTRGQIFVTVTYVNLRLNPVPTSGTPISFAA